MYNGTWHDIIFAGLNKIYVYAKGNEYTDLTGGWGNQNNKYGIDNSVTNNGSVIKHEKFLEFKLNNTSSRCCAAVGTANKIDLTEYKQIIFTFFDQINQIPFTKTLDILNATNKNVYIVCGIDRHPTEASFGNGLFWGIVSNIANIGQNNGYTLHQIDKSYSMYTSMYLESVELVPNL